MIDKRIPNETAGFGAKKSRVPFISGTTGPSRSSGSYSSCGTLNRKALQPFKKLLVGASLTAVLVAAVWSVTPDKTWPILKALIKDPQNVSRTAYAIFDEKATGDISSGVTAVTMPNKLAELGIPREWEVCEHATLVPERHNAEEGKITDSKKRMYGYKYIYEGYKNDPEKTTPLKRAAGFARVTFNKAFGLGS